MVVAEIGVASPAQASTAVVRSGEGSVEWQAGDLGHVTAASGVSTAMTLPPFDGFDPAQAFGLEWGAPLPPEPLAPAPDARSGRIATVAEPATWLLMLGGFGLLGASVRRRETRIRQAV